MVGGLGRPERDLVRRGLAEDGLGNINFVGWRHPYVFDCNQLSRAHLAEAVSEGTHADFLKGWFPEGT